jgi:hypothetical protein
MAWFRVCGVRWQLLDGTPLSVGTALNFDSIGSGNRDLKASGQRQGLVQQLIREMSVAIHFGEHRGSMGELRKLGINIGQTVVTKYMARGRRLPSQGWKTFLHNHAVGIASMDLFVVPTISF